MKMECPICLKEMKFSWRAPFDEPVFDKEASSYEIVRRPPVFIIECLSCHWQEIYDRLPGTTIHALQFGELLDKLQ